MIHIEDRDLETFALEEGDIAVPLEIYIPEGTGMPEITVYSRFCDIAGEFMKKYAASPFSGEAIDFLRESLMSAMTELGFDPSPDLGNCIREYNLRDEAELDRTRILPATRLIKNNAELQVLPNHTTHECCVDDEDEADACAIQVEEGAIAAYAAVNDTHYDDNSVEIHVECAPSYRNRGFAASCAAVLAEHLLKQGYTVRYCCRTNNAASSRVAKKLGFKPAGTRFSFVCYRQGMV